MLKIPADLKNARILIANDDSIHAEGIKVLEEIVRAITPNVWVVAPETQMSAAGHSLTIHLPLRIKQYDDRHYSVSGTPTDSVLLGVQEIMEEVKPDLVLTGINHGWNVADDVTYSGTIAAAIEASLMHIPAIAFSQDFKEFGGKDEVSRGPDWSIARDFLPRILQGLAGVECDDFSLISVNFPARREGVTPEIKVVRQGHYAVEDQGVIRLVDPRGKPYYWIGPPRRRDEDSQDVDIGALQAGHITITPLTLNMTNMSALKKLEGIFS